MAPPLGSLRGSDRQVLLAQLGVVQHVPGQHTAEILEALGYRREDIEELRAAGVVGMPEAIA